MAERYFVVRFTKEYEVKVRVPLDLVESDEAIEDVAEEFAMGGFPQYVIEESYDTDVDTVEECAK